MIFNIENAKIENLTDSLFKEKNVFVDVLRLDKIHPVVSGNKLFKLEPYLKKSINANRTTILTFGGAFSNHLVATAFACKINNIKCIGVVRGEQPKQLSHSLQNCINYGMQLKFITRKEYELKHTDIVINSLKNEFGVINIIPEGGFGIDGAIGASSISKLIPKNKYTHIALALGTGTTTAGLMLHLNNEKIIAVPVLKGLNDIVLKVQKCGAKPNLNNLQILNEYHFGGYAKKTPGLLAFMNEIWIKHNIPLDFVYTAKLFFAIYNKIKANYFKKNSHILLLHTGGLQGNLSLPTNTLLF